jgi:hypothetical protein
MTEEMSPLDRVVDMFKDGVELFQDMTDGDNTVDFTEVSEDFTQVLRDVLNLPIPEGVRVKSIVFEVP